MNDDGGNIKNFAEADIILVGVSRSGKTPTSLYLALQYGIKAANYPITEDDLESEGLPKCLVPYKHKLFGLTIDPAPTPRQSGLGGSLRRLPPRAVARSHARCGWSARPMTGGWPGGGRCRWHRRCWRARQTQQSRAGPVRLSTP